jgi:hypothetical protein
VIRNLAVAVAVLVLAAIGLRLGQDEGESTGGCDGVRLARERVQEVATGSEVPTSSVYTDVAQDLRRAAVAAPPGVSRDLHALADAHGQLAAHFQGFDPADPSTYDLIEVRTPEIEREEARVADAAARVDTWLQQVCPR